MATTEDLTKMKNLPSNTYVLESCTRERANTKWKFYKLTNVAIFAAFFKEVLMGCKNTVLPEPPLKNHFIKCFTYEDNTRKPWSDTVTIYVF